MNISKLSNSFSNISDDRFSSYLQEARVNEELQKMNQEITFEYMKNYLLDLFRDNPDYEIFDRNTELARLRRIIVPPKDSNTIWNEHCFAIWNPKNYATFAVFPALNEETNYYNCSFYIFSKGKADFSEKISFANQLEDVRTKIEFYIQSFSFLQTDEEKVNFNDLEIDHTWYTYSNMQNLTDDCIKKFDSENICKKDCENCDKCKNFYPMMKYTENHYYANQLINKFVEMLCKDYKCPVEINFTDNSWIYKIGNLKLELTLPKRKNKLTSSLNMIISMNDIELFSSKKYTFKGGKEIYELYMDLMLWYNPKTKKAIKKKLLLASINK